jgi:hypothetical protein
LEFSVVSNSQRELQMIKEKFGVNTSISAVGRFLKKHGIKCLKSGSLPAKANPQAQKEFHDKTYQPLTEAANSGARTVLCLDAAHFVHGSNFLGRIYGEKRRFVLTPFGRF